MSSHSLACLPLSSPCGHEPAVSTEQPSRWWWWWWWWPGTGSGAPAAAHKSFHNLQTKTSFCLVLLTKRLTTLETLRDWHFILHRISHSINTLENYSCVNIQMKIKNQTAVWKSCQQTYLYFSPSTPDSGVLSRVDLKSKMSSGVFTCLKSKQTYNSEDYRPANGCSASHRFTEDLLWRLRLSHNSSYPSNPPAGAKPASLV